MFIFLIIDFTFLFPFIKSHNILLNGDATFHFNQVNELRYNIVHNNLWGGSIATYYFNKVGSIAPSFYPNVFLYLWAFFSFIFKPVKSYYCWIIVIVYLTLLISYYSMYNFCKSKSRSFIFSLIYSFTQDFWFSLLHDCNTGEYLAYMLMPMVFLGFYKLVFNKKHSGLLLGISYSLLIYVHFVSVYLCLLIFILIFIAGVIFKKVDFSKKLLINILKTTFLIILLSFWVILPVIINFHYENILFLKVVLGNRFY